MFPLKLSPIHIAFHWAFEGKTPRKLTKNHNQRLNTEDATQL